MKRIALTIAIVVALAAPVTANPFNPATTHAAGAADSGAFRDRNRNRIDDALDQWMGRVDSHERRRAIVVSRAPLHPRDLTSMHRAAGRFPIEIVWRVFGGMTARLTVRQIRVLAARSDVIQIEAERAYHATMSTARRWYGVDAAVSSFGVTGDLNGATKTYVKTDVVACVVDTGVDSSHVDLNQGQVIGWKDFVGARTTPYDDNGHGSHVAGILAGQGDGLWSNRGVAYGTALVGVKVLNASGSGSTTAIINGVDFCVANKSLYGVRIINLSLGSSGSSDGTDALSQAVDAAADAGILPVVAAGNAGPDPRTIGSPAAAAKALTVCSIADPGERGFFESAFSSRGPTADGRVKPDVCGPGENITSAKAGSGNGYTTLSGTSMATPFVAGVAALMLDADPTLTPATLKSKVKETAQDWRSSGTDTETGAGRLQAFDAVKSAGGFTGTSPVVPNHYMTGAASIRTAGASDVWTIAVSNISYPIALTLNIPGASATKDFDLVLSYWTGSSWSQKASSRSTSRQETVTFLASSTGTYRVTVPSYVGTGSYYLDLSFGGSAPVLSSDG